MFTGFPCIQYQRSCFFLRLQHLSDHCHISETLFTQLQAQLHVHTQAYPKIMASSMSKTRQTQHQASTNLKLQKPRAFRQGTPEIFLVELLYGNLPKLPSRGMTLRIQCSKASKPGMFLMPALPKWQLHAKVEEHESPRILLNLALGCG